MANQRFSLQMDDRELAELELLRLQEAARLANERILRGKKFQRNKGLSHVVHASLNATTFVISTLDEIFHHLHHYIIARRKEIDPSTPTMPEQRNPIFFLYPVCMAISLVLCVLWLTTDILSRKPVFALIGSTTGAVLIMLCGIMAMAHADKYINLNTVSDAELMTHPIFVHNFVLCMVSILGMMIYLISAWILFEAWKWQKKHPEVTVQNIVDPELPVIEITNTDEKSQKSDDREPENLGRSEEKCQGISIKRICMCRYSKFRKSLNEVLKQQFSYVDDTEDQPGTSTEHHEEIQSIRSESLVSRKNSELEEIDIEDEPIILYCCCVDFYQYLKTSKVEDEFEQEFQVGRTL